MTSGEFRKRKLVTAIYLPSLLITAAEGALLPILPVSAVGFGFSLAEASIVTTVLMVSTMVFEVPASWLNSKIGERQAMIASAVLGFAMTLLAFFHLGYPALVLSALGFGAAHSLFGLARHSLLTEIVPEQHRPKSMSLLGGMFRGGMAIGPVLGSAFIVLYGVEFGYLAAAILCLAAGASVMFSPKGRLKTTPSGQNGNVWNVARREAPKLATLGVASAIISAGRTIRLIGLPLLAIQLGISPGETSFIFGLTGFIDFALFYLSGIIMDRYGKFWSSVPTLLALGTTYLFSFLVTDVFTFWILAAVTALANALSAGINMILGADLAPPGSRSEFLAAFRMLTSGGVALAPAMITVLTASVGLASALAATGLLNFVGAFLFWKYLPIYAPDYKKPAEE
jgi:MFS family permease